MTVGVAGVPGGSRLNISTPDNPRGRMSRQHGRRPSSYQRPYVYTSPCSTTLVSQERCSKTMGIVLPGVLRFWIHIYLDIYTRTCISPFLSESWHRDSTLYAKIYQQFISTEKLWWTAILYFSCFYEWRDYVLGSRISTIVEKAS